MSAAIAMMAMQKAQSETQIMQQGMMNMAEKEQTHNTKMAETAMQGDRARMNIADKFGNDAAADQATQMKNSHDSTSQAASA